MFYKHDNSLVFKDPMNPEGIRISNLSMKIIIILAVIDNAINFHPRFIVIFKKIDIFAVL